MSGFDAIHQIEDDQAEEVNRKRNAQVPQNDSPQPPAAPAEPRSRCQTPAEASAVEDQRQTHRLLSV